MGREVVAISSLMHAPASTAVGGPRLPRILAEPERLQRITVCTRPFRAAGPRIEAEPLGGRLLIHNYGHGGSGWSLSWGSAAEVLQLASGGPLREVAVVGCGALGLTSAIALQRAGARVTLYAREFARDTRSSRATGSWTPDARVALASQVGPTFADRWERMARASHLEYESTLRAPGEPVKVQPRFVFSTLPPEMAQKEKFAEDPLGFVHLEQRISDLWPPLVDWSPEQSPAEGLHAREAHIFRFDLTVYSELLLAEFRQRGGVLRQTEFHSLQELVLLQQPVIVNCTGFGARALLGDESLIPVRGQINWLPAQAEVLHSMQYQDLNVVSRPDGIVVQLGAGSDGAAGWQDASEEPNTQEAVAAISKLRTLQTRLRTAF